MAFFTLPTATINFFDFLQIEAAFLKANYITTDEQNISGKHFGSDHEISVLLDFYRHWLLKMEESRVSVCGEDLNN